MFFLDFHLSRFFLCGVFCLPELCFLWFFFTFVYLDDFLIEFFFYLYLYHISNMVSMFVCGRLWVQRSSLVMSDCGFRVQVWSGQTVGSGFKSGQVRLWVQGSSLVRSD